MLFEALTLHLGYNATLVTMGSALLGLSAGVTGTFLFLRKRALMSDAISHATLPGIGFAFILAVVLGGDGRSLLWLLSGSAVSATLGLLCVQWITTKTRLSEDAAIGAVLSVFFGFGIVVLTVIQSMTEGRQAGLEGFLLGSTAGMLFSDALIIALGGLITLAVVILLRRPMTLVTFDAEFAASIGTRVERVDIAMMALVMAVTVVGLKVVGLILIVALLIIPPVTARFWTNRTEHMLLYSGAIGGTAGYMGAAISATAPALPTGPIIVLVAFVLFMISLVFAPARGLISGVLRHRRFQARVHLRQGLLALAQHQPIYERLTHRLLLRADLIRPDGVPTDSGRARAAKALRDEKRWEAVRSYEAYGQAANLYDGLTEIENVLTSDQIAEIDDLIGPPRPVIP